MTNFQSKVQNFPDFIFVRIPNQIQFRIKNITNDYIYISSIWRSNRYDYEYEYKDVAYENVRFEPGEDFTESIVWTPKRPVFLVSITFKGNFTEPIKLTEFTNCCFHLIVVGRWNFRACRYTELPASPSSPTKSFGGLWLAAEDE